MNPPPNLLSHISPVPPRPAYLVGLTLDGLDAWTSNSDRPGLGDGTDASTAVAAPGRTSATWTHQTPGQLVGQRPGRRTE
jgi:hypothetical protein